MDTTTNRIKRYFMKKILSIMIAVLLCSITFTSSAQQTRTDAFHDAYALQQVVVLSRHNIRSPLSGPDSALGRITPHKWFQWSSAPSELSLRGGVLETMMGQFFRLWAEREGLFAHNAQPDETEVRFYANSMQRTIATARYFSSGMFPVGNLPVEHHYPVGTMDPVYTPQITTLSADYSARAISQIANLFGGGSLEGIGQKVDSNILLAERVIDIAQSVACTQGDTCHFNTDDTNILLQLNKEPAMTGGLKLACSVSDALVLQYYEQPNDSAAAFGHSITMEDWRRLSAIKDWYGDVLFTAPLVAINVAHPLLQEMLYELRSTRRFSFLCGHDSNIGSVLAALGLNDYDLPGTIEHKTPIGSKLVIEKWLGTDGIYYASLNLCYQTPAQLRYQSLLDLDNPPMIYPISLKELTPNADGLYLLTDLEALIEDRIAQYDDLLNETQSIPAEHAAVPSSQTTYTVMGQPVQPGTRHTLLVRPGQTFYRQ